MKMLRDKVAVVTGGASGIGLAYTKAMLQNGITKVYILDFNQQTGKESQKLLTDSFGNEKVTFIEVDVRNAETFEDAVKQVIAESGALHILINNAGIANTDHQAVFATNLMGTLYGIELAIKYMRKDLGGQGGVVISTGSIVSLVPLAGLPVYAASKHAILGLMRSYGTPFHYNYSGIKFMTICPGQTSTAALANCTKPITDTSTLLEKELFRVCSLEAAQSPETVANCLIKVLEGGENGSVWICKNEQIYEVEMPEKLGQRRWRLMRWN